MSQKGIMSRVEAAYDLIARCHVHQALEGVYTNYYEWPAMYSLLGNVAGERVLDAGCGHGSYSAWLVAQGATVTAIDSSPQMVESAKERLGPAVDVRPADLNEPLLFLETDSIDTILCTLVLDYVRDWETVFKEFNRILRRPGGRLIFSVHHPFFLDLKVEADIEGSYFEVQQLEEDWSPFGLSIPAYRRPLGAICSALWEGGFVIELIVEPRPTEACKDVYPDHYERLSQHPVFICIRARKTG